MDRKTSTREFTSQELRLVSDQRQSFAETAYRLGVHENLIRT